MKKFASMMVVAMVVVGCGGDVSEDDARSGWAKTNAVLSSGGMAAQSSAGDTAQDPSYRALPVGTSVDYQYACSGGGTLHFVGTYEVATGLGTERVFAEARARKYIDSLMLPLFKEEMFFDGLWSGCTALVHHLELPENRIE